MILDVVTGIDAKLSLVRDAGGAVKWCLKAEVAVTGLTYNETHTRSCVQRLVI